MKPNKKPLSDKKFKEIAEKVAYEKYITLEGIGKTSAILSKTDDSYICSDWPGLRPLIEFGVTQHLQAADNRSTVAQIGFNPKIKAWYGWSHRAIAKFKIGHKVKKGDVINFGGPPPGAPGYKEKMKIISKYPIGFIAKTQKDCKQLAILFAKSVS